MIRSRAIARPPASANPPIVEGMLALALSVGGSVLLAWLLMAPPSRDLRLLAMYLVLSIIGSTSVGWLGLRAADRFLRPGLPGRAFLATAVSTGVALLNLLIVAELMFVSTAHDLKLLFVLIVSSAVVTLFFSVWTARAVAGRIRWIAAGIEKLADGDYAVRTAGDGSDEVARLARDVDRLAARLQAAAEERSALDRERRELTAAVSHDLRTPLASIRAMVEALDDRVVSSDAEVARYHATMRREIERLSKMMDDLFDLAQTDSGSLRLQLQPVALQDIAAEVVDAMQARARLAGVTLQISGNRSLTLLALDGARVERAIANLVSNAITYTPEGGMVDVSVDEQEDGLRLSVRDSGHGIPADDLERVWDRFYRGEKSRVRRDASSGGAGLGLAIVRSIIEAHGGSVSARSRPGEGSVFSFCLPARGRQSRTQFDR